MTLSTECSLHQQYEPEKPINRARNITSRMLKDRIEPFHHEEYEIWKARDPETGRQLDNWWDTPETAVEFLAHEIDLDLCYVNECDNYLGEDSDRIICDECEPDEFIECVEDGCDFPTSHTETEYCSDHTWRNGRVAETDADDEPEIRTGGGTDSTGTERCDPAELGPSRAHVRQEHTDPGDQLVESVSNVGIVTPPIGRVEDSKVRLIDGVRRAKAAAEAGIETIPVVVRDLDDTEAKCQSLTLNDAEAGIEKEVLEEDREKSLGRLQDRTGLDREGIEGEIGMLSNAERIARELADVPGVGRKTAERIAEHYDYEDLVEEPDGYESGCWAPDTPLSAIDGVGEQTAGAIRRHLWGEIHA